MTENNSPTPTPDPPTYRPRVIYWHGMPSDAQKPPSPADKPTAPAGIVAAEIENPEAEILAEVTRLFPSISRPKTPELAAADAVDAKESSSKFDIDGVTVSFIDVGGADPHAIAALLREQGANAFVEGPPTNPPLVEEKDTAQQIKAASVARKAIKKRIAKLGQPQQGYLEPAPLGIDARYAWNYRKKGDNGKTKRGETIGFRGQEIQLADIEQGWQQEHIEIEALGIELVNENREFLGHGTAVLGVIAAEDDGVQITGIAHKLAKVFTVSQWDDNGHYATACAIQEAAEKLHPGDVLLIEAQTVESGGSILLPVEIEDPVRYVIQRAVKKGIVVIEAAGNGGFDLDEWCEINGERPMRRRTLGFIDSGAIMVAAANPPSHSRALFSNYGSRIDCFAWGSKVYTAGDGFRGRSKSDYTADFTGTSAAAAIVAGAAAVVQSLVKDLTGKTFDSITMRSFLANPLYGTLSAAPPSDQIGVMPNLKKIFAAIDV